MSYNKQLRKVVRILTQSQIIKKITNLRTQKGLSQNDLAKITGIKQPVISRMEQGITNPRLDTVTKIVDALEYELTLKEKEK